MDPQIQSQIDALFESAHQKEYVDFVTGIKYNWDQLAKLTPEEYQRLHPDILAFENIHYKYRAKAAGRMDPVFYAIFTKACHLYMLLVVNPALAQAELDRMVKNDAKKEINVWKLNYDKMVKYLKTGVLESTRTGGVNLKIGWTFHVAGKKIRMNDVERQKLIDLLDMENFMKTTGTLF